MEGFLTLKKCVCACVCVATMGFWMSLNSEGFISLTINEGKKKKYGSDRREMREEEREKDGAEGRARLKTGLFEAADLFITVLLLLTLTFE